MKTEKFDDEIRRKIERLNFPPSNEDVERVHSYVKFHQVPTFWGKFGKIITYSSAAAAMIASIVYNSIQFHENKTLLTTIESLKQAKTAPAEPITKIEHRTDTVYITKYIHPTLEQENASEKYAENHSTEQQLKEDSAPNTVTPLSQETEKAAPKTAKGEVKDNSPKNSDTYTRANQSPEKPERSIGNNSSNKGEIIKSNEPLKVEDKTFIPSYSSGGNENGRAVVTDIDTRTLDFDKPILSNKSILIDSASNIIGEKYSMIPYARQSFEVLHRTKRHNHFEFPSISIKGVKFRTGLAGEFQHDQLAGTVLGEALIGRHLGISFGLKYQSNFNENYPSDEHFEEQNHQNFRQNYAPQVPNSQEILNISIVKNVISVPILINYYQAIGRNFWLFGGVGTNLDLSIAQNLRYDFRPTPTNFQEVGGKSMLKVPVFNNVVYALGIEKRLNHFDFQLSPQLISHFQNVPYSFDKQYFTGQFKVLYRF